MSLSFLGLNWASVTGGIKVDIKEWCLISGIDTKFSSLDSLYLYYNKYYLGTIIGLKCELYNQPFLLLIIFPIYLCVTNEHLWLGSCIP